MVNRFPYAYDTLIPKLGTASAPFAILTMPLTAFNYREEFTSDPMDSRKLLYFYTIARCGSIGEAARQLHLTRSALSHAVRSFERELGFTLFDRTDRRVILTGMGKRLLPMANDILSRMESAMTNLRDS